MFVARIDLSPEAHGKHKDTVEITVHVKTKAGEKIVWCGLSSGSLQVVDLEKKELKGKRITAHQQLVTCLCAVNKSELWSGSFDKTIKVTNMRSKRVLHTLTGHTDAVTCILREDDKKDAAIWSAGLDGQILRWDLKSKELHGSSVVLRHKKTNAILPIYSLKIIENQIWCGTGESIVILDYATLEVVHWISSVRESEVPGVACAVGPKQPDASTAKRSESASAAGPAWGAPRNATQPSRHRSNSLRSQEDRTRTATAVSGLVSRRTSFGDRSPGGIQAAREKAIAAKEALARRSSLTRDPPSRLTFGPGTGQSSIGPAKRSLAFKPLAHPVSLFPNGKLPGRPASVPSPISGLTSSPRQSPTTFLPAPSKSTSPPRMLKPSLPEGSPQEDPMLFTVDPWSWSVQDDSPSSPPRLRSLAGRPRSGSGSSFMSHATVASVASTGSAVSSTSDASDVVSHTSDVSTHRASSELSPRRRSLPKGSPKIKHLLAAADPWGGGGDAAFKSPPKNVFSYADRKHSLMHGNKRQLDTDDDGKVAANTIIEGVNGQLWTCSDRCGRVQLWSIKSKKLIQSWELNCPGLHHMVYSRGHMWVAGLNGSVYIWDAEWHLPLAELQVHKDAVRSLCPIGSEFVVSNSGATDGSIAVLRAVARGRVPTQEPHMDKTISLFDRYGFLSGVKQTTVVVPTDLSISLPEEDKHLISAQKRRQTKHLADWETFVKRMSGSDDRERILPASIMSVDAQKFPELIPLGAKGISERFRAQMWKALLQSWLNSEDHPTDGASSLEACSRRFKSLVPHMRKVVKKTSRQIELDLMRTFPSNKHFRKNGTAIRKLQRVLLCFSLDNPKVAYCQGFNFIVGFALLFVDEPTAFCAMKVLIERIMPTGYYMDPMLSARADQPVFRDAVARWLPALSDRFEMFEFDLSLVTFNWFFTLYVDCVPVELTLKIWDLLLILGDVVIFQFALALLKANENIILQATDQFELFSLMRGIGQECTDVEWISQLASESEITVDFVKERRAHHVQLIIESDAAVRQRVAAEAAARLSAKQPPHDPQLPVSPPRMAAPAEGTDSASTPQPVERGTSRGPSRGLEASVEDCDATLSIPSEDEESGELARFAGNDRPVSPDDPPRPASATSSQGSWVEIEERDAVPSPISFKPRSSHITIFSPVETGGTGDGRLLPGAQSMAASVDKWFGSRLTLARSMMSNVTLRPSPESFSSSSESGPGTATNSLMGTMLPSPVTAPTVSTSAGWDVLKPPQEERSDGGAHDSHSGSLSEDPGPGDACSPDEPDTELDFFFPDGQDEEAAW